jgi:hypothetical protein
MESHHATGSFRLEQLEQRRMLSAALDALLEEDHSHRRASNEVVVSVLGSAGSVAAAEVTFQGTLQGTVTRSGAPPIISVNVAGDGNATQLGQFAVSIPHQVNVGTRTATGQYLFVAANGDTLTATFTGHSMPTTEDPTILAIEENATITGGTGRFARATGSFTTERLYDTIDGTTIGAFEGTISSPGAAKR